MKPSPNGTVAVVGAGLAGSRVASELRRLGHLGPVLLIGEESSEPYDRPPLSKAVLTGRRDPKPLKVDYAGLDVTLRLGTRVESVDLGARRLGTSAGPIAFDQLVIASGAHPLRLPGSGPQLTLRTDRDALALRGRLVEGTRVVLVGASWIGAEVAHAARQRGCSVTALEFHPAPLTPALGVDIGRRFAAWWPPDSLRTDARVVAVEPDGVHLAGGELVPADVVVCGIGVRAATEWLSDTGLELLPAVAVDEHLRADGDGQVYAVGDAAASWSPRYGRRLHIQHWDNAYSAPTVVASGIALGDESELVYDPVPYFWSDQFGHRIEYVGQHDAEDTVEIDDRDEGWVARWRDDRGRLTAVLGVDQSKLVLVARRELLDVAASA